MERYKSAGRGSGTSTWWGWLLEDKQRREEGTQRGEVPAELQKGGGASGVRL